ncbi:hypothetical protein COOONC_21368 [Cooperia oncophora]
MRWTEAAQLEVIFDEVPTKNSSHYLLEAYPNVPLDLPFLRMTMTLLTLPPIPKLNSEFVTDGVDTAILTQSLTPTLKCASRMDAEALNCTFKENCVCTPAEFKVICECEDPDIAKEFDQIQQKLPIKTAYWELSKPKEAPLTAKIPQMVSSEIVINFHTNMDAAHLEISNHNCIVADAPLKGCYNCPKGAVAIVRCIAEEDTFGEILCAHHSFVVSCAPEGPETTLHFHLDSARHLFECTITCGQVKNTFRNMEPMHNERTLEEQLRDLLEALPPLPSKEDLHEAIFRHALELRDCISAVDTLETRLKALRSLQASLSDRKHEAQYLDLYADYLRARNFLTEELENETVFEKEIRAAIERLQQIVIDTREEVLHKISEQRDSSRAESPEGLEHRELRIIKENSEFAEGIKEEEDAQMDPEEEEVPPPELAEDEESGEEDDGDRQGSPPAQEERHVADNNVQLGAEEPEEEEPEAVEPPRSDCAESRMKSEARSRPSSTWMTY